MNPLWLKSRPRGFGATEAMLLAASLTLLLYFVPGLRLLAWPLVLISTLMHELGHGLAALLLGGSFETLNLWSDASGLAVHHGDYSAVSRALIAAAGPLGPPLSALVLFWSARRTQAARVGLGLLALGLVVVCLLWVRNLFGFCFVALFAVILALIALRATPVVVQVSAAFLALQMSLSVFSRMDYLFSAEANTGAGLMPSDTAQMAQALWLPYWWWGALIGLVAIAILIFGLWLFARAIR